MVQIIGECLMSMLRIYSIKSQFKKCSCSSNDYKYTVAALIDTFYVHVFLIIIDLIKLGFEPLPC